MTNMQGGGCGNIFCVIASLHLASAALLGGGEYVNKTETADQRRATCRQRRTTAAATEAPWQE